MTATRSRSPRASQYVPSEAHQVSLSTVSSGPKATYFQRYLARQRKARPNLIRARMQKMVIDPGTVVIEWHADVFHGFSGGDQEP
jgi:hypothetical protein